MDIQERVENGVLILKLIGILDQRESEFFANQLIKFIDKNSAKKIILDMQESKYIDSSGLGKIICIYSSLARKGEKKLEIACPTRRVAELFRITKLDGIIKIHDTLKEAVESFKKEK